VQIVITRLDKQQLTLYRAASRSRHSRVLDGGPARSDAPTGVFT